MHIVHLYKDYDPPIVGGIERMLRWTAERQVRRGWQVTAIVAEPARSDVRRVTASEETIAGVRVLRLPAWGRPGGTPLALGIARVLARLKADVAHAHHPCPTVDYALWGAGPKLCPPFVVTWHSDVVRQRLAYRAYRPLQRWLLNHAACIMPTSQRYAETSEQLASARARDILRVVPLGIDFDELDAPAQAADFETRRATWRERLRLAASSRVVLFVGVLRYYKGLTVLLDAWPRVVQQSPNAVLAIVGEGPLHADLERQRATLGDAAKSVHLLGALSDADVAALRSLAHIATLPSTVRAEAFGLSQIEAMAAGLPVVACDLPTGVPEVNLHDRTGLIVPPNDAPALADALASLLSNAARRASLSAQAREHARLHYNADRMEADIAEVYASAVHVRQ